MPFAQLVARGLVLADARARGRARAQLVVDARPVVAEEGDDGSSGAATPGRASDRTAAPAEAAVGVAEAEEGGLVPFGGERLVAHDEEPTPLRVHRRDELVDLRVARREQVEAERLNAERRTLNPSDGVLRLGVALVCCRRVGLGGKGDGETFSDALAQLYWNHSCVSIGGQRRLAGVTARQRRELLLESEEEEGRRVAAAGRGGDDAVLGRAVELVKASIWSPASTMSMPPSAAPAATARRAPPPALACRRSREGERTPGRGRRADAAVKCVPAWTVPELLQHTEWHGAEASALV